MDVAKWVAQLLYIYALQYRRRMLAKVAMYVHTVLTIDIIGHFAPYSKLHNHRQGNVITKLHMRSYKVVPSYYNCNFFTKYCTMIVITLLYVNFFLKSTVYCHAYKNIAIAN